MAASCMRLSVQMHGVFRRHRSYIQLFRPGSCFRISRPSASLLSYRHALNSRPLVTSCHRYKPYGTPTNPEEEVKPTKEPQDGFIKKVALKTHLATVWLLNKVSPTACGFYVRFVDGMTSFVQDFRYVYSLNRRLKSKEISLEDLEWKDLYRKVQMKEDLARVLPTLAVVNIPFVFYVALPVVLYFQRIFLSNHFLSAEDIAINHGEHHKKQRKLYPHILKSLEKRLQKSPVTEETDVLRTRIGQLEEEPLSASELLSYHSVFGEQAALSVLSRTHLKSLCKFHSQWVLFAPNRTLRKRLLDHARLLSTMDQAIMASGLDQIEDLDLRKLCNQRGFNPVNSDSVALRNWLEEWNTASAYINDDESSLLLHASILLVAGQPNQGDPDVDIPAEV